MLNAASAAAAFAETRIAAAAADAAIAFEGNTWVSELLKVERGRADESQAARLRENARGDSSHGIASEKHDSDMWTAVASDYPLLQTKKPREQLVQPS